MTPSAAPARSARNTESGNHTGSVSRSTASLWPSSNSSHSRADTATIAAAKARKIPVMARSKRLLNRASRFALAAASAFLRTTASPPVFAATNAASTAGRFSSATASAARNPMRGDSWNIFCHPAVPVTVSSQTKGINVTSASFADLGPRAPDVAPPRNPVFSRMVVARQSAMAASSWLAMPKMGQSALVPPSGFRTALMSTKPQPATINAVATMLAKTDRVFPSGLQTWPRKSWSRYRPTRVPASSVVRMNNASNMMAKWYQRSSQRPCVSLAKMLAMPTASVAAPPVRP